LHIYAALCSSIGKRVVKDTSEFVVRKRYPAWFEQQRPASAMKQLTIDWHVPLGDIKRVVEQQLQQGTGTADMDSEAYQRQGRSCKLELELDVADRQETSGDAAGAAGMARQVE
jgi:hypothetical protein